MSNELVKSSSSDLPEYLRDKQKTVKLGNIDQSDLVIPRAKLIQNISPEVTTYENAKIGEFWHTVAALSMGSSLLGIPIVVRKSYLLWAPRSDANQKVPLARALDGVHWDVPGAEFTVQPKGSPKPVTYHLGKTVQENGMDEFGSSIPGLPSSPPAASLTYNAMWWLPEYPDYSPIIIINTRTAIKPMKGLMSKIELRPVDHYYQQYKITSVQQQAPEGKFWNYAYESAGYADEKSGTIAKALFDKYAGKEFIASDETDEAGSGNSGAPVDDKEVPF